MNESSRIFLDNNRHHYDLLVRAQYIKHLDMATREGLLNVIRIEFNAAYNANLWCPECVTDMLKFAYTQYDKYLLSLPKTDITTDRGADANATKEPWPG